jgi:hypothetical protein
MATWCAHMPVRLGADACHISRDGWAITGASSPTGGGRHQGLGGGGLLELCTKEIVSRLDQYMHNRDKLH